VCFRLPGNVKTLPGSVSSTDISWFIPRWILSLWYDMIYSLPQLWIRPWLQRATCTGNDCLLLPGQVDAGWRDCLPIGCCGLQRL